MLKNAKWTNGVTTRLGSYEYRRHSDTFYIVLDKPAGFAGEMRKNITLHGYETPEWKNWRLIRD